MSNVLNPTGPPETETAPVANRFTPDAQERVARLRLMAEEFPDESDPRPLTSAERRLARQTSAAALEKAALFAEATPGVGGGIANGDELREAIAFELAYGGVRDEAAALARRVEMAILRRKLKAVRLTRGLYRVAKGFITIDAGDAVRTHVEEMKRTLVRPRRRKPAPAPASEPLRK